jgi:hypothetical protein
MKRFPAYTIVELMVVCLLTTFVVLIAMQCIRLINTQYEVYEESQTHHRELGDLNNLIRKDNLGAHLVQRKREELIFVLDTMTVQYQLNNRFIIRKPTRTKIKSDTFQIKVTEINTFFKKEPVILGLVDYIDLGLFFDDTELKISLQKKYSAAELMNIQAYAR